MSTTVENIASNKVKLSFDIDSAKFDEAMGKAYLKVRGQVNIPGFRKGKAPRKLIENMYGEGVFYDEAFELVFDEVYGPSRRTRSKSSTARRSTFSRSARARTCSSPARCLSSRTSPWASTRA